MEKSNQTIRIDSIELRDAEYGRHLNDRLESINANFETIISSDYLRGDDGVSVGVEPWVINTANLNSEEQTYIDQIITAILKLNTGSGKNEQLAEGIKEYLNGKTIHLIKKETGELLSSLPFTYIDQRFSELKEIQDKDLENMFKDVRDLSCIIHYDNGEFKAIQSFPTIYWDSSLDGGDLCWMINGEKTGLSCRGPQGANGISGRMYTAFYNIDPPAQIGGEHVAYHIVAVLTTKKVSSESKYENEYVYADEFSSNGIDLNTGDTVIGIPCKFSNENGVKTITVAVDNVDNGLTVTDKTSTKYTISTVYVDQSTNDIYKKYVIVSDGKSVEIPLILENAHLDDLLKNAKLLYVPAKRSGDTISTGHAIWNEQSGDNNNMCLGTIDNPTDVNKELSPISGASVTVKNDIFNVGSNDCLVTKTQASGKNLHIEQSANVAASQPVTVHNFDVIDVVELRPVPTDSDGFYCQFQNPSRDFSTCQLVETITDVSTDRKYYTGLSKNFEDGSSIQSYIQWESFGDFVDFITVFREYIVNDHSANTFSKTFKVGEFQQLEKDYDGNKWVANSFNATDVQLTFRHDLWRAEHNVYPMFDIGHVNNIKLADNGYFDYEIYWYHSSETSIVKSPILFNIGEYKIPTSLPIKRRSESNDVDEVLYIAKNANSWTDIIVPNIEVTDKVNQNEMLPYPAKRTKKYVNAGHYGKLIQDFDKYEGHFDEYTVNSSKAKIEGNAVGIVGEDVNIDGNKINIEGYLSEVSTSTHVVKSQNYTIETNTYEASTENYSIDSSRYKVVSDTCSHYFQDSMSGTDGVWSDSAQESICSFDATKVDYGFECNVKQLDDQLAPLNKFVTLSTYIPMVDMGDEYGNSRFRIVYKISEPFTIRGTIVNYLIIYSKDRDSLYGFFENCETAFNSNKDMSWLLRSQYGMAFVSSFGGEIVVEYDLLLNKLTLNTRSVDRFRFKRNFSKNYKDIFAWDSFLKQGVTGSYTVAFPYVMSTKIEGPGQFILCRSVKESKVPMTPDNHVYLLVKINDNPNYEYTSLIDEVTESELLEGSDIDVFPNTYNYLNPDFFNEHAVPTIRLYDEDNSRDCIRVDKIHRFCNEYNINGINLLDKIAELEARIQTLENNN